MNPITVSLSKYCEPYGAQAELARLLDVPPQELGRWKTGARRVPVHRCHEIEAATRGMVTCESLRPDLIWVRVRSYDPVNKWPWNRRGRPLLDVTKCTTLGKAAGEAGAFA